MSGETGIRINEIRFVAEDGSVAGMKVAAQLTAKALGASGDKMRDIFEDPNKLLQLILAAERTRGGGGGGGVRTGIRAADWRIRRWGWFQLVWRHGRRR